MIRERETFDFPKRIDKTSYISEIFLMKIINCLMRTGEKKQFPPGTKMGSLKKKSLQINPISYF